ncbi:MAG: asparaginase [Planctomycetes bacterium]|nr:asparaginase [Planctomycetota bacterium]
MPHDAPPVLCRVLRGEYVESVHRGSWVVYEGDEIVDAGGSIERFVYPRSALKPFQLLPHFAWEGFESHGFDASTRAILFASHSGDESHIERVDRVLRAAHAGRSALACGPHDPLDRQARIALYASGGESEPIHNNCSGKHAGFLLSARRLGAPLDGYLLPEHPVQVEVRDLLSELTEISPARLVPGVDGCGAPNWPLPLTALARLFRDLANPERLPERLRAGADRILGAAIAEPHFIAGRGRFDTALLSAGGGRIFGKCGAEGVFAIGVRAYGARPPIGIAMKVEDGNKRAYEKALGALLAACRILERTDGDLAPFLAGALRNTRGLVVGRSVSRWDEDFDRDYERL